MLRAIFAKSLPLVSHAREIRMFEFPTEIIFKIPFEYRPLFPIPTVHIEKDDILIVFKKVDDLE
jgi:hypothetical protein